jgi:UDP-2,3-diacylglucosamine pyrophosphatase LpxH
MLVLENYEFGELIVLGDIIETGGKIKGGEFKVLRYLYKHRRQTRFIDGNHDPAEESLVKLIMGKRVLRKYEWYAGGKKLCVIHGHQFDRVLGIFTLPFLDRIFTKTIRCMRKVHIKGYGLNNLISYLHSTYSDRIAKRARKYARHRKRKIDIIICGHTHEPLDRGDYYNTGSWVEDVCSFITVSADGVVELHLVPTA